MRLLPVLLLLGCQPDSTEPVPDTPEARPIDPGHVMVHRLNKAEYDATVRDLLGTSLRPARDFPDDDFSNGWDNMAAALSLSPLHLEMYERAAWLLVDDVLGQMPPEPVLVVREAETDTVATVGGVYGEWAWMLWSNGTLTTTLPVAWDGDYTIQVRAFGTMALGGYPRMRISVDGLDLAEHVVDAPAEEPGVYEATAYLDAGTHEVVVAFLNDAWNPDQGEDRNLSVDWIGAVGPYDAVVPASDTREALLACDLPADDERACAREVLVDFVPRAWRRPVEDAEIDALMALFDATRDADGSWEEALRGALVATLVSPHFLFRIERDPDPSSLEPRPLDGYELASRLSYFLWSSMPDDELFELAETGELLDDQVLQFQVSRMLEDPKALALVDNFAGQWLLIRAVDDVFPDTAVYPDFDAALQIAMKEEMRLYAKDLLLTDRSMRDLLTAKEAWVDGRLARHYGLQTFGELGHVRVDTTGQPRAGFVTTAGLLTVLSYPARTSPVRRGKWVMSSLLCETPAPPPPEVEGLPAADEAPEMSIRDQMEAHRADPVCASCHHLMDPIGFAFEHYDGVGAYRTVDERGYPIDSTGRLPDGTGFDDVIGLMRPLSYSPKYSRCVTQKTFTYALGRVPTVEDVPVLAAIEAEFVAEDLRFEDLVRAIVLSEPFRWRRGAPEVSP